MSKHQGKKEMPRKEDASDIASFEFLTKICVSQVMFDIRGAEMMHMFMYISFSLYIYLYIYTTIIIKNTYMYTYIQLYLCIPTQASQSFKDCKTQRRRREGFLDRV
jgi:hypothetical protein